MPLVASSRVGPYEILAAIGAGGMGEVYRARDSRLERDVALKVLPAAALADATARARLLHEARLASKLNHPHICTIYDVGEAEPSTGSGQAVAYIAMELVEGQSLADRLRGGALPIDTVVRYGQQLAGALAHAHGRGVVHRDLKSANVVVTPDGQVKVLDFGLAKRLATDDLGDATTLTQSTLTEPGIVAGTLAYMAPEQLAGQAADARSDIWALGVVLYELVAGQRPFQGKTGFELSSAILKEPVPTMPAAVPVSLAGVIDHCLAKHPGDRYQRAGEVEAALAAVAAGPPAAGTPRRARRARRWVLASLATAVLVAGLLFGLKVGGLRSRWVGGAPGAGARPAARIVRVAVLPFANLSGNADQEYLSDGLTAELIAQLGRLHPETLRVSGRVSVMLYKNSKTPIGQISRELGGVDYMLGGSAQREANRVRITAELIKVVDQTQVWTETYEREAAGVLILESEVAQKVGEALALKLLPAEQARLSSARPVNPEAHDAYLKGLQHWYHLTPGDLDAALRYFELALEKDPSYAPAYAGVAMVWGGRSQMGITPPGEAGPKAKAAALRAIQLDDTAMEAHYELACIKAWTDWDWPGAEAEFKRAIALNPNFPDARMYYSHYLNHMGRPTEAMPEIERAIALDPYNPLFQVGYAIDLLYAHRYDEALEQARRALRTQPDLNPALNAAWLALSLKGMHKDALDAAKAYMNVVYGDRAVEDAFDRGYAHGGYAEAMRRAAQALAARARTSYVSPFDTLQTYVQAGDTAQALEWLEKCLAVREPNLPYVGLPDFDRLRPEPRFQTVVRRMGLPQ